MKQLNFFAHADGVVNKLVIIGCGSGFGTGAATVPYEDFLILWELYKRLDQEVAFRIGKNAATITKNQNKGTKLIYQHRDIFVLSKGSKSKKIYTQIPCKDSCCFVEVNHKLSVDLNNVFRDVKILCPNCKEDNIFKLPSVKFSLKGGKKEYNFALVLNK